MLPTPNAKLTFGNKVALKPGHSLLDWIRFCNLKGDLTDVAVKPDVVTVEDLETHNTQNDGWLSIRGKVYNVSPYMDYHPGGIDELMRGVGKDGTTLFDEVHSWVNIDTLLEKCYVGRLKDSPIPKKKSSISFKPPLNLLGPTPVNGPQVLPTSTDQCISEVFTGVPLKYDWTQTSSHVTIIIQSKLPSLRTHDVICYCTESHLYVAIRLKDYTYVFNYVLEQHVTTECEGISVSVTSDGDVVINLPKEKKDCNWSTLGTARPPHGTTQKSTEIQRQYYTYVIESLISVTHDTNLYRLRLPPGLHLSVPLGHHISLRRTIEGMNIERCYTPVLKSLDISEPLNEPSPEQNIYLMIKMYSDGLLTSTLQYLRPGDSIEVSAYEGVFDPSVLTDFNQVTLLAAGTGFTPMVSLIVHCLRNNKATLLLFFNKTYKDILWREQLDRLCKTCDHFEVVYVLSEAGPDWSGLRGRLSKDLLQDALNHHKHNNSRSFICACGPTPFTKDAVRFSEELGYTEECIHAFLG